MLLTACGPEATPFPVDIPTINGDSPSAPPTTIRYALADNTRNFVSDLPLIQAAAKLEQLTESFDPTDLGSRFDIVAAYGDLPGSTRSPVTIHMALVINTTLSPLDSPPLATLIRSSPDTDAIVNNIAIPGINALPIETLPASPLRTNLANAGWPDGILVRLIFVPLPGIDITTDYLASSSIRTQGESVTEQEAYDRLSDENIHLALVPWRTSEERRQLEEAVGEINVLDLYDIPISYVAVPNLEVTFTPGGWPIPQSTSQ